MLNRRRRWEILWRWGGGGGSDLFLQFEEAKFNSFNFTLYVRFPCTSDHWAVMWAFCILCLEQYNQWFANSKQSYCKYTGSLSCITVTKKIIVLNINDLCNSNTIQKPQPTGNIRKHNINPWFLCCLAKASTCRKSRPESYLNGPFSGIWGIFVHKVRFQLYLHTCMNKYICLKHSK